MWRDSRCSCARGVRSRRPDRARRNPPFRAGAPFEAWQGVGRAGTPRSAFITVGASRPDCEIRDPSILHRQRLSWLRDRDGTKRSSMVTIVVLGLSLIIAAAGAARAQDIAGIEDCTKTSGLDKRTGCFQSNINFLQRLVNKNALEASQKLNAADAEIVALKSAVTRLQKTVEQLQAAQKAAGDKKPETK